MAGDNSVNSMNSVQPALEPKPVAKAIQQPKAHVSSVDQSSKVATDVVVQTARLEQIEDMSVQVAEQSFSVDRIKEMIKELEAALPAASNSLSFHVDEALDRPVITVVNKESGEVVRTLPSEEIIRVAHNIEKMRGILFDSPT